MLGKIFKRSISTSLGNRVGFIGLGSMGFPMVKNLIKHGYKVTAYDLNKSVLEMAEKVGAIIAPDVTTASKDNDIVVTMVPKTEHVKQVREGKGGIFESAKPGALIMDWSTINPAQSAHMSDIGEKLGFKMADAPCSGAFSGAEAGTLTFMLGWRKEYEQPLKDFLLNMGNKTVYCGDPGKGHLAKICNNLSCFINMMSICEALSLGEKLDIDPKVLSDIMSTSTGSWFALTRLNPVPGVLPGAPSSNNYKPGFTVDLAKKDLGLAIEYGDSVGLDLQFSKKAREYLCKLEDMGIPSNKDFSIVYEYVKSLTLKDN